MTAFDLLINPHGGHVRRWMMTLTDCLTHSLRETLRMECDRGAVIHLPFDPLRYNQH